MIKIQDHCHYTEKYGDSTHDICNLSYETPKEIPVVFHNGSNSDYHFIMKQMAEEFEGQFEREKCLGENTEKWITFSVPIKKENESCRAVTYKIKLIDSVRLMPIILPKDSTKTNAEILSLVFNARQSMMTY